ncbi:hypothetical protein VOLCADRAFT_91579 [Volvox carteri f. nagariensis]|uniref:PAS domain-containing protein n=1 Tax=Volvox carteri f. nagariensis TaxID=3068 RepID=D8TXF9_VOLCA|nr:uncharacterized protein VOLCADRAFT_91579 [Volvox carteri f. nagariensis]EFJ48000.1 hypothetical protein VOLCADRAFT_91579 [Volvox carteri f. nagariensis]|eukprot:XP_002951106.1 hypothetical protein VOLCADRAFT_91579 [Volvox carteri f. nagariensis]
MYTLVRQTALAHWKYAFLKIVLEFLMNFVVAFNPTFKTWRIDTSSPLWQVVRWTVWRSPIMHLYGYRTYILGLAWLTLVMRKQEQSKVLRLAALGLHVVYDIFFVMCYVAFFECLKMPHLLHMLVALSGGILFLFVTALVVVASCDLDPVSRAVLASPAAYARLKILFAKAVFITFANCLDSNTKVQVIGMVASVTLIVFWNLRALPFYFNFTNVVWTGLWCGILYPCVILVVVTFGKEHSDAHYRAMTQASLLCRLGIVLYGMFPAVAGGMAITSMYVWWAMRPARKFRNLELGIKLSKVHKFESVYEVERLARVMRKFDTEGLVEEDAAALGGTIIKAGLQTFPNAPHLLILYANYMLEVRKDGPSARTQLQLVGKQMPNVVERYQVFCTNEASKRLKDSQEEGMDLQAYMEFKRNLRAVLRVHKDVLLQQSELWQMCMRDTLRVAQIDEAMRALEAASTRADQVYRRVLERYPTNGKLLRCYGKFLEDVRHDQVAAARAYAGANRVGSSNALLSLDFGGTVHCGQDRRKPDFLTSMSLEDDAVVVIDAEGTIMMVSQAVQRVFGYSKVELEGANVSLLMPQPFSQRHAGYVQRCTSTGEPHILDTVREMVALHKDRYVFPTSLCVTRLSGVGSDSIFLGVIRPLPASLLNMRAWISPNGVFLCADQQFSSAIGMVEGDVVGHTVATFVVEPQAVTALLARCQAATAQELESGDITTELIFHHRFLEPVLFRVEVRMAGSDAQRILVLHCRRTDGLDGSMLAVDTHMRVKFASCEVALLLGYSMRKLASMRLDQLLPPPYNALHAKWLRDCPHTSRPGSCRTGAVVHLLSEAGVHVPVRLEIRTAESDSGGPSGGVPLYIVKARSYGFGVWNLFSRRHAHQGLFAAISRVSRSCAAGAGLGMRAVSLGTKILETSYPLPKMSFLLMRDDDHFYPKLSSVVFKVKKVTQDEMVREKRLVLTVDFTGKVMMVSPLESAVFEFPALALVGTNLAESIDIFADWHRRSGETQMQMILLALLGKEQEMPGTSWRVRVREPVVEGDARLPSAIGAMGNEPRRISRSACLQVELDEEAEGGGAEVNGESGVRIQVTLWRRDLLSGVLELDDELIIRRASPLAGLITGLPTFAMLRRPLSQFLNIPHSASWDKLVAATRQPGHGHHKKSALKATTDRGSISPVMAFIGPHPDSGTMRLMVQGVRTLGPGARPKVTLTMHPDTTFAGAHANLMRVLRLEDSCNGGAGSYTSSALHVDDDVLSRVSGQARSTSAIPPALRSRSFGVLTSASQPPLKPRLALTGGEDGHNTEHICSRQEMGGAVEGEGRSEFDEKMESSGDDDELGGGVDDENDGSSSGGLMAQATCIHRQATSKSEFVMQWVRSITHQGSGQLEVQAQRQRRKRSQNLQAADRGAAAASSSAAVAVSREESSLLALPLLASQAMVPRATSRLPSAPEAPLALGAECRLSGANDDNLIAIPQLRGSPSGLLDVQERQHRAVNRVLSFAVTGPLPAGGGACLQEARSGAEAKIVTVVNKGRQENEEEEAAKSDKGSTADGSSVDDGSQVASAVSGTTDATSVSEVVIDARRGRLLKALNKVMLGPALMAHIDRLKLRSYILIIIMFVAHLFGYVTISMEIRKQYTGIYAVHGQALAMDRSQLIVVRTVLGTFCERANVTERVAGCAYSLQTSLNKLQTNALLMEQYHQGVYLGFDGKKTSEPEWNVYNIWTRPLVDYQVFLDTTPPQTVTSRAGAWQLGNRFIAAAREAVYWMAIYKENFKFHRIHSFIQSNGLGSLFGVYASSLDYLVAAAWKGVLGLRKDMLIFLAVEGLFIQICCALYELFLVHRLEAARVLGVLAIVGLPKPVLRRLAAIDTKTCCLTGGLCQQALRSYAVLEERGIGGRTLRVMRLRMSRKGSRGSEDQSTSYGSKRLCVNGKSLLPSYSNVTKFMVPFMIWSIAVIVVYTVTLVELNKMQSPLASLNLASRIVYRYTRLRAIGAVFVSQDDSGSKDVWRPLLSSELDTLESEYSALMYGGVPSSMANSTFRRYVPAATFASASFARLFFQSKGCFRIKQETCFTPGNEYYEITHNGLDAMVRRLVYELRLLSLDDDADVTYNNSRYAYTSIVGANDLYEGLQQAAQLFVDYSITHYTNILKTHTASAGLTLFKGNVRRDIGTILLVVSVGLMLAYFVFLLWPHIARTARDAARQSALLSLVPPEMDVRAHVRMVFKRGIARKKAGNRAGSSNKGPG